MTITVHIPVSQVQIVHSSCEFSFCKWQRRIINDRFTYQFVRQRALCRNSLRRKWCGYRKWRQRLAVTSWRVRRGRARRASAFRSQSRAGAPLGSRPAVWWGNTAPCRSRTGSSTCSPARAGIWSSVGGRAVPSAYAAGSRCWTSWRVRTSPAAEGCRSAPSARNSCSRRCCVTSALPPPRHSPPPSPCAAPPGDWRAPAACVVSSRLARGRVARSPRQRSAGRCTSAAAGCAPAGPGPSSCSPSCATSPAGSGTTPATRPRTVTHMHARQATRTVPQAIAHDGGEFCLSLLHLSHTLVALWFLVLVLIHYIVIVIFTAIRAMQLAARAIYRTRATIRHHNHIKGILKANWP